jgi:hypothetical protein
MPGIFIAAFVAFVVFVVLLFAVLIIFRGWRLKNANETDWDITTHNDHYTGI